MQPEATIRRARRLRKSPTFTEAALWPLLRDRAVAGLRFRRQAPIGDYVCDFVCLSARLPACRPARLSARLPGCLFVCLSVGFPADRYGIPGKHAKGFEACLAKELGETLDTVSEHLYRITKMLSPVYLQRAKVRWMGGAAGGAGNK